MSFFSPRTTRPRPELSCSWRLWERLKRTLREHCHGTREAGAFLLGRRQGGCAHIADFLLYDELDPHALDSGIIRFDGRHFGELWEICEWRGLSVVADVHVHPDGAGQSDSDRHHPMICQAGHIALILPRFAAGPQPLEDIGMYRYLGGKRWDTVPTAERRRFFRIGLLERP